MSVVRPQRKSPYFIPESAPTPLPSKSPAPSGKIAPWPPDPLHLLPNAAISKPLIISDPAILYGRPVVAGTRLSVELILEKLGAGESIDDLLADYPHLSREAVLAAERSEGL